MTSQLALGIRPIIKPSFANYIVSKQNQQVVEHLKYLLHDKSGAYLYLWGAQGVGKTHLLQAICNDAEVSGLSTVYLSLNSKNTNQLLSPTDFLSQIENYDLFCLDDIQFMVGDDFAIYEELLFSFYNLIKDSNKSLIITSDRSVISLNINLPDLRSRLSSGVSYKIKLLDDQDKKKLLKVRAFERGMILTDDLAQYLISRGRRDINGLFCMLDELDNASLRYKRKLSIPFARDILFHD